MYWTCCFFLFLFYSFIISLLFIHFDSSTLILINFNTKNSQHSTGIKMHLRFLALFLQQLLALCNVPIKKSLEAVMLWVRRSECMYAYVCVFAYSRWSWGSGYFVELLKPEDWISSVMVHFIHAFIRTYGFISLFICFHVCLLF